MLRVKAADHKNAPENLANMASETVKMTVDQGLSFSLGSFALTDVLFLR